MTGAGEGAASPGAAPAPPSSVKDLLGRARDLAAAPPDPRLSPLVIELSRRALAQVPGDPDVSLALARALHGHAEGEEAAAVCDEALAAHPEAVELELERLLLTIPVVYREEGQPARARAEYAGRLEALAARLEGAPDAVFERLGRKARRFSPYLLPYQGLDDAPLQRRLGALTSRAVRVAFPPPATRPAPSAARGGLRVGFVSDHFFSHTIWHAVTRGWLAGLRARGFACYGYAVGGRTDDCTAASRRDCVRFVQGDRPVVEWAREIRADRLDALIYPAIGYSPVVETLALTRLAPLQCTTFGHCETTGFPTMDCFLSSALMEPPEGDAQYTETLVRLPDVGLPYSPPAERLSGRGRDHPGVRRDAVLLLSPHPAKKYLPEHDRLYLRIAESIPGSQLVFFRDARVERVSRILERRLRTAFSDSGLDPDGRVLFLDRLGREDYVSLLAACDVYLDVPGWNGGTTTAEALAHHVPVVTLEGSVARGRMGAGLLRHVGLEDGIAATPDDYVELAARLGADPAARDAVRRHLAGTAHRIHDDAERVDGLAGFLRRAAGRTGEDGLHPG